MIRNSSEQMMIERYLKGEMSPQEQQEFRLKLSANNELRRHLQVESAMTRAMHKERAAVPVDLNARERALAAIGRIAPSGTGGSLAVPTVGGAAAAATGTGGYWRNGAKIVTAVILTGLVLVGVYNVIPSSDGEMKNTPARTTVTPASTPQRAPESTAPASSVNAQNSGSSNTKESHDLKKSTIVPSAQLSGKREVKDEAKKTHNTTSNANPSQPSIDEWSNTTPRESSKQILIKKNSTVNADVKVDKPTPTTE